MNIYAIFMKDIVSEYMYTSEMLSYWVNLAYYIIYIIIKHISFFNKNELNYL